MSKDTDKYISQEVGTRGVHFKHLLGQVIVKGMLFLMLEPMEIIALLGQISGDICADNDARIEPEFAKERPDIDTTEPMKKTFMLNFDVSYNDMRSMVSVKEPKPEPKVV